MFPIAGNAGRRIRSIDGNNVILVCQELVIPRIAAVDSTDRHDGSRVMCAWDRACWSL